MISCLTLRPWRTGFAAVVACIGLIAFSHSAHAQPPVVAEYSPLGGKPGETVNVAAIGSALDGATELWSTCSGKSALTGGIENNGKDAARSTFSLAIPQDAPLGLHGLRTTTGRGTSRVKPFLVDDLPSVAEAGGNGTRDAAQTLTVPCSVDGHVDALTRDFYRFHAEADQKLTFEVWGRRLASPLDPVIFLYREDGRELNFSDDAEGLSSDPQLVHTFDRAGDYIIEVRDIQYRGGTNHYYRLRIGDFPAVNMPVPAAVQAGVATRIDFSGIDVADATPVETLVPADYAGDVFPVSTRRSNGSFHAFGWVAVNRQPEFLEREPNDTKEQANRVPAGHSLNGSFDQAKDVDRFIVTAAQGEAVTLSGLTRQIGSPTDLVVTVFKPDGSQLATVDDTGVEEGTVDLTFPEAGDYVIEIQDLHRRGGPQYAYRVLREPTGQRLKLTASSDVLNIPAGGVEAVTLTASRGDHGGLTVSISDLPPGFTAHPTVIGPGLTTAVLTVEAAADAPVGILHPVKLVAMTSQSPPLSATADVTAALKADWNNPAVMPGVVRNLVGLAVAPASKYRMTLEPMQVSVKREQKVSITIRVQRGEGIDEALSLVSEPEKNALPKGIGLELKAIDKGQNEIVLELTASKEAALGTFSLALKGIHKKGNDTLTSWVPSLTYTVTE